MTTLSADATYRALQAFMVSLRGMTVAEARTRIVAAGYNLGATTGPDYSTMSTTEFGDELVTYIIPGGTPVGTALPSPCEYDSLDPSDITLYPWIFGRTTPGGGVIFAACPVGFVASACSNSGTDFASEHSAWSGRWEERVDITTTAAIAAGTTLIALVGTNRDGANATRDMTVYDEQGNTWTMDAESNPQGDSSYVTQIWRCNVTAPLASGDYIRFAGHTTDGPGGSSDAELFGRCIGVYAFSEVLGSPNVGASADSFGSTHTIPAPAGDVVIGGLSRHEGAVTGDGDWEALIPSVAVGGAAIQAITTFGQHKRNVTSENWVTTGSGSKDWSGICVGYTSS